MRAFLRGLRSWQLFVLTVVLLVVDLAIPDPLPFLDEMFLGAMALLLSRRKRPPV